MHEDLAQITNPKGVKGTLADAMKGANVFIGVSAPDIVTKEMVKSMDRDSIVLAMANPDPEIHPELAKEAGARIVGTGRSDYANQVNNVLAFPGVFRGALDVRASDINEEMKVAAAFAIATIIPDEELSETNILPAPFDERIVPAVAAAVAEAARKSGTARL
jgi:malate dehydrogenase (oxaloacetate-decarboxylating)